MKAADDREAARKMEARVRKRVREFDIGALLKLLQHMGWSMEEVRFASHRSIASQTGLVHDIWFRHDPRQVRIELNLGLLSAQSALPSYFFRMLDEGDVPAERFEAFVGYFDHLQLMRFIEQLEPALNHRLYPDWEASKRGLLQLLNVRSSATLHWLFRLVFPELRVSVEKAMLSRTVRTGTMQLGQAVLGGDAAFGASSRLPVLGARITLYSDEERALSGNAWPQEIEARCKEVVYPVLGAVGMEIEMWLVLTAEETWATLEGNSYLGHDRVRGGDDGYRRIRLHSGLIVN